MMERIALAIVWMASVRAPGARRQPFLREWRAEIHCESRRRSSIRSMPLLRTALGAFADAQALRRLERDRTWRGSMGEWLMGWGKDGAVAVRGLLRSARFSGLAVLMLALGMGGSAAVYTLLDRIVLDPLPYPDADRLVALTNQVPGVGAGEAWAMSTAQYVYFTEHARSLSRMGLYRARGATIQTPSGPQRAFGWNVTADVMPLVGARAQVGRLIDAEDDLPGATGVVALSHEFWQRQFGEDPGVVGRTLLVDDQPYEVIGVLAPGLRLPRTPTGVSTDLWMPMGIDRSGSFHNSHVFPAIAQLAPDADPVTAMAELERLTVALPERFPEAYSEEFFERYGFRTEVTPLKEAVVGAVSRSLWILFGALGLVLFLASANVANLFLVRLEERRRELSIRAALGAGRAALVRHLLAEGLALSVAGGVLALALGFVAVPVLVGLAPTALPRIEGVAMDGETVLFTAALAVIIGLGLAVYPVLRMGADAHLGDLSSGSRSVSGDSGAQRLRAALVVVQVALALMLVAAAGLLIESLRRLNAVDPGIRAEGLLATDLHLTPSRFQDSEQVWLAYRQILESVRALPGVTAAGMSQELPVEGGFGCTVQGFADETVYDRMRASGRTTCAGQEPTTPGYFETAGIPLVAGRTFQDSDNDDPTRGAVVVSQAFAERFWPGEDPLGKGVAPSGRTVGPFYQVVGVVGDVPAESLDGQPAIAVYYPIVEHADTPGNWYWLPVTMRLLVRTDLADPLALFPQVREAVRAVDPAVPVSNARRVEDILVESTARLRFTSLLLTIAAGVALTLAAVGLYGVVAYLVSRRTREIGMRIAIGAQPSEVERLFVRRTFALVAIGLVVGLILATSTGRVMEGVLFGIEPTHPLSLAGSALVIATISGLATWLPARRASRVDPVEALRAE